jgi:hypothetical protein
MSRCRVGAGPRSARRVGHDSPTVRSRLNFSRSGRNGSGLGDRSRSSRRFPRRDDPFETRPIIREDLSDQQKYQMLIIELLVSGHGHTSAISRTFLSERDSFDPRSARRSAADAERAISWIVRRLV